MKQEINWLKGALAAKEIVVSMTWYRIVDKTISATDGRMIACHPWPYEGDVLVPGMELEKVVSRVPEDQEIDLVCTEKNVLIKAQNFKAKIPTVADLNQWAYPGVKLNQFYELPKDFVQSLKDLHPFISQNATQPWANCVCLNGDWMYATNNVAVAGLPCQGLQVEKEVLLPLWAIDFILKRPGVKSWQIMDNYIAFQWENGAWMRTQVVMGQFPVSAFKMVQDAAKSNPSQIITEEFRDAFERLRGIAEEPLRIYGDRLWARLRDTELEETVICEIPPSRDYTIWNFENLIPIINNSNSWSPSAWPKPSIFRGERVAGVVVGRVS
jgi:hypothetical protein